MLQESKSRPTTTCKHSITRHGLKALASTAVSHTWLETNSKHSNAWHGLEFWQAQWCLLACHWKSLLVHCYIHIKLYCCTWLNLEEAASTDYLLDKSLVFCFDLIPIKGGSRRQGLCPTWRLLESSLNRHSQNCNSQHSKFKPWSLQPKSGVAKMITCHRHTEQCNMWAAISKQQRGFCQFSFERLALTLLSATNNIQSPHNDVFMVFFALTHTNC